ncbi:Uncharacterised protein [Vibrio cholerae]|nr:Uncharacterised protein [Vibrio cholerae]
MPRIFQLPSRISLVSGRKSGSWPWSISVCFCSRKVSNSSTRGAKRSQSCCKKVWASTGKIA